MHSTKKHIVVLSGAGISAESGIKTFRDADGLWMGYNIEDVATPRAFVKNPQLVLDFYNLRRKDVAAAQPNAAHLELVKMEQDFDVSIITQNIDDLHERAGSSCVMHLHGEIFKMHSIGSPHKVVEIRGDIMLGDKGEDGTQFRPHIVWFEEPVPMIEKAVQVVLTADILVIIGTSLQVYPAASLIHYAASGIPIYCIDKKIPAVPGNMNIRIIEKPASIGVAELNEILKSK